jgi:hypothetical protein
VDWWLIIWFTLLLICAFSSVVKSNYHFRYLKRIDPERLAYADDYLQYLFTWKSRNNFYAFEISWPSFTPHKKENNDPETIQIKRMIKNSLLAFYASSALAIIFFVTALLVNTNK